MEGFDPRTSFGSDASKRYDAEDTRGDEDETVAFLARLAGGRDALELAVGTGRIALPLTAAGVRVDGIELSQHMVDRMREKPGGNDVEVTMGDMSRVDAPDAPTGWSTWSTTRSATCSRRTTRSAASRTPRATWPTTACSSSSAGCRPRPRGPATSSSTPSASRADHVVLDVCRYDPVTQILDENHVRIGADGVVLSPISLRLAHPPEFDLMARLAGLRLRERWGGWNGEPFTAASWRHVSVYEPAIGK